MARELRLAKNKEARGAKLALLIIIMVAVAIFIVPSANAKQPFYSPPSKISFCGEKVPLEHGYVAELLDEAFLSAVYFHSRTILWLKKANRFFPHIERRLRERNMPDDLKYIMVAESSFRYDATSSSRAAGFWQFMEATAKKKGLRVDKWIDERRNFERSTEAALDYLAELHSMFGSWTLAAAAYNCGENRLKESIDEQGTKDYCNLRLPAETEMYLFRILAAKIVLSNPRHYGYFVPTSELYKPLKAMMVKIDSPREIALADIAKQYKTSQRVIRDLNPEIRGGVLPAGTYRLKMPEVERSLRKAETASAKKSRRASPSAAH